MKRVVLAFVFALVARSSFADTVQIRSGSIDLFDGGFGPFAQVSMQGDDFMGSIGGNPLIGVVFLPFSQCGLICGPTTTTIAVGGNFLGGSDTFAAFTYQGLSYPVTIATPNALSAQFSGSAFIVPSLPSSGELTLYSTFTLTGNFFGAETFSGPFVSGNLVGQGTASITLRITEFPGLSGGPYFVVREAHYEFQDPIPEPASILLLGAGLTGALARRRSRRLLS